MDISHDLQHIKTLQRKINIKVPRKQDTSILHYTHSMGFTPNRFHMYPTVFIPHSFHTTRVSYLRVSYTQVSYPTVFTPHGFHTLRVSYPTGFIPTCSSVWLGRCASVMVRLYLCAAKFFISPYVFQS